MDACINIHQRQRYMYALFIPCEFTKCTSLRRKFCQLVCDASLFYNKSTKIKKHS